MTFRKNHKLGAQKFLQRPLDKQPISFRGYEGQHAALKNVPNWQERFRNFTQQLIEEFEGDSHSPVLCFPRSEDTAKSALPDYFGSTIIF